MFITPYACMSPCFACAFCPCVGTKTFLILCLCLHVPVYMPDFNDICKSFALFAVTEFTCMLWFAYCLHLMPLLCTMPIRSCLYRVCNMPRLLPALAIWLGVCWCGLPRGEWDWLELVVLELGGFKFLGVPRCFGFAREFWQSWACDSSRGEL